MPAKIGQPSDGRAAASLHDWLEKERALALRDEWHQLVLANTSDLISTHTPDTAFVFVSGACRRLLGYEPDELAGRSIFEFMHTDDLDQAAQIHRALLDSSESQVLTYRFRCSDGRHLWTETTFRVMGRPLGKGPSKARSTRPTRGCDRGRSNTSTTFSAATSGNA